MPSRPSCERQCTLSSKTLLSDVIRPLLHNVGTLRVFSHYLKYLGSLGFRRRLVELSPHGDLRKLADAVDRISSMSKAVLQSKKEALTKGDAALEGEVGEGQDIMSILCTFWPFLFA